MCGGLHLKSMQLVIITKSKIYRSCYKVGSLCVKEFKQIKDELKRDNLVPFNTLTNLNCTGSLFKDFIL